MAKVTSKLQVTIPKVVAEAHGIRPGTELEFESADETIRVRVKKRGSDAPARSSTRARTRAFDEATERQRARDEAFRSAHPDSLRPDQRGWSRSDLYGDRGLAR